MSHPAFTDDDRAFLRGILANPAELTAWLVYADWLDEHDDPRAEFIRLEVKRTAPDTTQTERFGIIARLEELRPTLDADWVAIFDRPRIENCDGLFTFECPKHWENLKGTPDPTVRHCDACARDVYYCDTIDEAAARARRGECVAVAAGIERSRGDLRRAPDQTEVVAMGLLNVLNTEPEHEPPTDMSVLTLSEGPVGEQAGSGTLAEAPRRRPWWRFW